MLQKTEKSSVHNDNKKLRHILVCSDILNGVAKMFDINIICKNKIIDT